MRHSARYGWALCAGAAVLAVTALPGDAAVSLAKGWDAPVLVSKTQAARETSLVINPKNNNDLFICDPSGVPAIGTGQSYFFRSTNGGKKWSYVDVESGEAADSRQYAFEGGDCDVAYDAGGTMYAADTWLGNLSVGSSRNGEDWTGTAVTTTAPVVDRPWLVGGPAGTVYLSFHDLQCCTPSAMWFTKSTDYGKTFSPAVPITAATHEGAFTWEGNFVVAPGGKDIHLVYSRRVGNVFSAGTPEIIALASSHDGGLTWTSKTIATIPRETTSIYPSIGMDAGGYLHVVWAAPRDEDSPVFYTASKDGGATWSAVKVLNSGKSGFAPWVVGAKKGQAVVAWLGSPVGKPTDSPWYFYVSRINGSKHTTEATTRKPIWTGRQTVPEFEMVRLDKQGRIHLGMSVFASNNTWAVYYQRESIKR